MKHTQHPTQHKSNAASTAGISSTGKQWKSASSAQVCLSGKKHAIRVATLIAAACTSVCQLGNPVELRAVDIAAGGNVRSAISNNAVINLLGNAIWNESTLNGPSHHAINSITVTINGNGHTINHVKNGSWFWFTTGQTASKTINIYDTHVVASGYNTGDYGMFRMEGLGAHGTVTLNLEGSSFTGLHNTKGDYRGSPLGTVVGTGSTLVVNGGLKGVLFQDCVGKAENGTITSGGGVLGSYESSRLSMLFKGNITFKNNYTPTYGGAVAVHGSTSTATTVHFNNNGSGGSDGGKVIFDGNSAQAYGGALDYWGYGSNTAFYGEAEFTNNYVFGNSRPDGSYLQPKARGGAINIGWLGGTVKVEFKEKVTFRGNHVIGSSTLTTDAQNAVGGALSAYSNENNSKYSFIFEKTAIFDHNYAYGSRATATANGGAIAADCNTFEVTLGPGSQLTNNYAKSSGGAIYLARGTINLNSDASGDILFEGNYDALSSWTGSNASWTPNLDSGKRNAVHLGGGIFNVNTGANSAVHFKDPITSSGTPTFNKGGAGDMIFYDYSSTPQMTMNVNLGRLVLRNDKMFTPMIEYGAVNGGKLTVGKKDSGFAAIVGTAGTRFRTKELILNPNGRIIVEEDSTLIVMVGGSGMKVENNAGIGGHGIVRIENENSVPMAITTGASASNNFYITTPNAGDRFRLESLFTTIQNGIIGAGKLHKEGPGTFYANGFTGYTQTGRNQNTYTGGTAIWDGAIKITDFANGHALARQSSFSLGTGTVEVNANTPAGAFGRLAIDFAESVLDINGTYTINNTITTSTTTGGEVYVDLAKVPTNLQGLPNQNSLAISSIQNFKGDLNLRNLQYTLTAGSNARALTNANLIVGQGSFVTVPTGDSKMAGLNLAGGILYFANVGYQSPITTDAVRMSNFIDAVAASPKGVLALGVQGVDPVSYIRLEATGDEVRDIMEGSNGQPNTTPLLLQDNYGNLRQLVAARTATGSANNVVVQVSVGGGNYAPYVYAPSSLDGVDHSQGTASALNAYEIEFAPTALDVRTVSATEVVAKKIFDTTAANLNTGPGNDGLYLGTQLDELKLLEDKVTLFDNQATNSKTGGNDFTKKISGSGHLGIVGTASPIVLSSTANTYTGATVVYTGTLQGGAANVIANSSVLWVKAGATFDTGAYAQRVNTIHSDVANPSGTINIPTGGALTVYTNLVASGQNASANVLFRDRESFFNGNLKGSGDLTLKNYHSSTRGGILTLAGKNEFTGDLYFDSNITGTPDAGCNVAGLNLQSTATLGGLSSSANTYPGDIYFGNSSKVKTTLKVMSSVAQTFSGDISGPAGLNGGKNTLYVSGASSGNTAKLTLTGNNTAFFGDIAVGQDAILNVASDDNLNAPAGARYLIGGTFKLTGANGTVYAKPWTVDPVAGGTLETPNNVSLSRLYMSPTPTEFGGGAFPAIGVVKKTGAGTLTLTGNNTLTGASAEGSLNIEIRQGNLTVSGRLADGANGGYKGAIGIEDGSVLTFSTPTAGSVQWLGTGSTITQQDYDATGPSRTGNVVKTGPGTLGVDGTITAPFAHQGGVLEGMGTIVNPTFSTGVFISPGTSAEHDHLAGVHNAGTIGTLTLGKVGSTTHFTGITYDLDVDHNFEVGGTGSGYYKTDLINVPGGATFGSGGATTTANRNVIDVSDLNATGGVHTPGNPWVQDRKYVILHAAEGLTSATADLMATSVKYKGISLPDYAVVGVRLAAGLIIENGTDLVFQTKSVPATALTWNYFGAGSRTWTKATVTDIDWLRTESPYSADIFYDLDTVHFVDDVDITKNIDVTTVDGGIIVSDMFVEGTNFVFGGGKIVGTTWELTDGVSTTPTKGRLTIEVGASARFNNAVDMEDIVVKGEVVFNGAVGSKGHAKSGGDYTGYSLTIGSGGKAVLDTLGTFSPSDRPVISILNNGTLGFSRARGYDYTYNGVIAGTGAVFTSGAGNVILTGNNTYTGKTTVGTGGGALYINGTSTSANYEVAKTAAYTDPGAVSPDNPQGWVVEYGSTLGGKGILSNVTELKVMGPGATFAPGVSGDGTLVANDGQGKRQIMTVAGGTVRLAAGSTFLFQIMGDGSGGAITSGLHLGSGVNFTTDSGNVRLTLQISNYNVKVGDEFILIDYASSIVANDILWTDTYGHTALANGGDELKNSYAFKYQVLQDGGQVWIKVTGIIPEPSTYGLLSGLGLLGLLAFRQRRTKKNKNENGNKNGNENA